MKKRNQLRSNTEIFHPNSADVPFIQERLHLKREIGFVHKIRIFLDVLFGSRHKRRTLRNQPYADEDEKQENYQNSEDGEKSAHKGTFQGVAFFFGIKAFHDFLVKRACQKIKQHCPQNYRIERFKKKNHEHKHQGEKCENEDVLYRGLVRLKFHT